MAIEHVTQTIYLSPSLIPWARLKYPDAAGEAVKVGGTRADGFLTWYSSREAFDADHAGEMPIELIAELPIPKREQEKADAEAAPNKEGGQE